MATMPQKTEPRVRRSRIAATVRALVRTRVTAGLLVVLPLWVTWLLVKFVFDVLRDSSRWLVDLYLHSSAGQELLASISPASQPAELPQWMQWGVSIACVLLTIFLLYAIGLLTANIIGARLFGLMETLFDRVPLVKTVYRATKQILATFAGEQSQSFQRVALVPFPDASMRAVGFITAMFRDHLTGEELCAVFIATTPNPTTGYLQIVRRSDITEVDWSVEDAVRSVMSGGILLPTSNLTIVQNSDLAKYGITAPGGIAPAAPPPPEVR